jgi:uncharacterized membrane protein YhiD involved in acid resistance
MVSFLELFALAASVIALGVIVTALPRYVKAGAIATIFSIAIIFSLSQSALAAVNEDVLTQEKQELHENLKTAPQGTQYQGLEYARQKGEPLSDRQIESRVRSKAPNDIRLSVSNGSVRISGRVSDRQQAQKLVEDIKAIPGVHEVSYDLGLDNQA